MRNFTSTLKTHYETHPGQICLVMQHAGKDDLPVTYRELVQGASGWAALFRENAIQPGEVIVLIMQHSIELVHAYFGAILHGAIPSILPYLTEKLSPDRYRANLTALVGITQPAAIVTFPEFEAEVRSALNAGDSVRAVILTGQDTPREPNFASLPGLQRDPQEIVLLQHSSGTTGLQKGIALSHRSVFNQLDSYTAELKLTPDDVIVSWLPLYHDMGLIACYLMPLLYGVKLVLMSPFDWVRAPYRLLQSVSKYRGTLSWLPNFAYVFCAEKIRERDLEGVDLSSWRAITNCSEPVRISAHEKFAARFAAQGLKPETLMTSYAMAENTFAVTQSGMDGSVMVDYVDREGVQMDWEARPAVEGRDALRLLSSGHPIANTHVHIFDQNGEPLPERKIGEVAIQSDCMLSGFFHREDLTRQSFVGDWYLTGDFGYLTEGELFVTGRKKDLIIVGGKNIYPADLEQLAMEVPGVHPGRVVAFGVYNEESGTEEVVIVSEVEMSEADEQQRIANEVRQKVTKGSAVALRHVYLVPSKWILKTSSGKTARLANKEKYLLEMSKPPLAE